MAFHGGQHQQQVKDAAAVIRRADGAAQVISRADRAGHRHRQSSHRITSHLELTDRPWQAGLQEKARSRSGYRKVPKPAGDHLTAVTDRRHTSTRRPIRSPSIAARSPSRAEGPAIGGTNADGAAGRNRGHGYWVEHSGAPSTSPQPLTAAGMMTPGMLIKARMARPPRRLRALRRRKTSVLVVRGALFLTIASLHRRDRPGPKVLLCCPVIRLRAQGPPPLSSGSGLR